MSNHTFRVLTGFDNSREAEPVLRLAFEEAGAHPLSSVHVVKILPRYDLTSGSALGHFWQSAPSLHPPSGEHQKLERDVTRIFLDWSEGRQHRIGRINVHTRSNSPAVGIVKLAEELAVDLIVVGTHARKGLRRFLFGSVAEAVVRASSCPVLVARLDDKTDVPQYERPWPHVLRSMQPRVGAM
jgi:nucleotide-binding universal stress UspA family protein